MWDREPAERGQRDRSPLQYGIAVRDAFPEHFDDAHLALFGARHDQGLKIADEAVLRDAVRGAGLDPDAVAEEVQSGRPLKTLAAEHTEAVERWNVFGVPTYVEGDEAVFVRFMERGRVDDLERMLDLLQWTPAQRVQAHAHPALTVDAARQCTIDGPRSSCSTSFHSSAPGSRHRRCCAARAHVTHVEVQRRCVVGPLEQLDRARERWSIGQDVGQGNRGEDAAATVGTRRHRGRLEPVGEPRADHALRRRRTPPPHRRRRRARGRVRSWLRTVAPPPSGDARPGAVPSRMRALIVTEARTLAVEERPDPEPGPGEVLVRVHGAGLNRADLVQLAGFYAAPPGSPADIPGLEFAGEVVGHGAGVSEPAIGARVFGIAGGGGQAELLAVPATQCAAVPESLDLVAAGAVPEVFVTAHDALVTQAAMQAGEVVLVHAVGSGVGTAAVQLARATGCTVVGTARTPEKLDQAKALGMHHGVLAAPRARPRRPRRRHHRGRGRGRRHARARRG